jgi:LCP family protein required for cell wall assembly
MRSKSAKIIKIEITVLLLIGLVIIVLLVRAPVKEALERPLGPTLAIQHATSTPLEAVENLATEQVDTDELATSTLQPTNEPKQQLDTHCGGPGSMIILAIGADNTRGYYYGLADTIRAVRVDFVNPGAAMLAFPRDLWVEIPGLEELRGRTHARANQAYFFGNLYRLPGGGPTLLAQTLYDNFGLITDHYLAVNMSVFVDIIDAVGGVDIYIPVVVDGREQGLSYFEVGWQNMDGAEVLKFSRIRIPDGEWHRQKRQNQVLLALRNQLLKPQNLVKLPSLAASSLDDVLTDLSLVDIAMLSCLLPKIEEDRVTSYLIEYDMVTPTITDKGAWVAVPHVEVIRDRVADFMDDGFIAETP